MGKLGATEDFIFPSGLLQKIWKNSWWFMITKYTSMHFFKCLKAIARCTEENYLTLIFPMLFKWEIESSGADSNQSNWTLSPYGIFFLSSNLKLTTSSRVFRFSDRKIVYAACTERLFLRPRYMPRLRLGL